MSKRDTLDRWPRLAFALVLLPAATSSLCAGEWTLGGNAQEQYVMEPGGGTLDANGATISLRSKGAASTGFGSATSGLDAEMLRRRRVTITGEVRTRGVTEFAKLYLRLVNGTAVLMTGVGDAVSGDVDWTRRSATLPVPSVTTAVHYGVLLWGGGQVSVRDLHVEISEPLSRETPIDAQAKEVLASTIEIVKKNALQRDAVSWGDVEAEVWTLAAGALQASDVYPVIRYLLSQLGDHHSFVMTPADNSGFKSGKAENPIPEVRSLEDRFGYIRVPAYAGGNRRSMKQYTRRIHELIGNVEPTTSCGWVVDLRQNSGGNMWPMLAGLKPLLGRGSLGTFDDPTGSSPPWIAGAQVGVEPLSSLAALESVWVAVLTGPHTASSGEAVVIAFRGRPHTRSFGEPTAGLSTANQSFPLPDGGMIQLTVAVDADRTGHRYGDKIEPDERVDHGGGAATDDDAALSAAKKWLTQVTGCAAASLPRRDISRARNAGARMARFRAGGRDLTDPLLNIDVEKLLNGIQGRPPVTEASSTGRHGTHELPYNRLRRSVPSRDLQE